MLLGDARNVRERLIHAITASSSVEEAEALAGKQAELKDMVDGIVSLVRRNTFLRQEGVPLSPVEGIDKAKQIVSRINDRFVEAPKAATLVDGRRWVTLVSTLDQFRSAADALQKQDWKLYFISKLFGGVPPAQRKQTILQALPENRIAIDRYTQRYERFNQYRNTVPSTVEELREVHECSEDLAAIKFVENVDVPVDVSAFFNATSSGGGAGIDLLTLEVIEWLRTNNMLANYVVRAR